MWVGVLLLACAGAFAQTPLKVMLITGGHDHAPNPEFALEECNNSQ